MCFTVKGFRFRKSLCRNRRCYNDCFNSLPLAQLQSLFEVFGVDTDISFVFVRKFQIRNTAVTFGFILNRGKAVFFTDLSAVGKRRYIISCVGFAAFDLHIFRYAVKTVVIEEPGHQHIPDVPGKAQIFEIAEFYRGQRHYVELIAGIPVEAVL